MYKRLLGFRDKKVIRIERICTCKAIMHVHVNTAFYINILSSLLHEINDKNRLHVVKVHVPQLPLDLLARKYTEDRITTCIHVHMYIVHIVNKYI